MHPGAAETSTPRHPPHSQRSLRSSRTSGPRATDEPANESATESQHIQRSPPATDDSRPREEPRRLLDNPTRDHATPQRIRTQPVPARRPDCSDQCPFDRASTVDARLPLTGANDALPYGSHEASSPTHADCCGAGAIRQSGGRGRAVAARSNRQPCHASSEGRRARSGLRAQVRHSGQFSWALRGIPVWLQVSVCPDSASWFNDDGVGS